MRMALLAGALAMAGCEETTRAGASGAVTTASPAVIAEALAIADPAPLAEPLDAPSPADPEEAVAGPADGADVAEILIPAGAAATLAALRLLDTAGREVLPRAEAALAGEPGETDRCALDLLVAVALGAGHADGARFTVWLADRAEARGEGDALAAATRIGRDLAAQVQAAARQAELDASRVLGFEEPLRLREVVGLARDASARCPADAARRMAEVMDAEEAG